MWKKSIFHRDFDQKISKLSWIFHNYLHFWSKRARFCRDVDYFQLPNGNPSSVLDDPAFFYKFHSIFSKDFMNFHYIFKSPSLSKLFLSIFHKFLSLIIEFIGNLSGFIGYQKIENFKRIFRKNSEILVKYIQFS